MVYLLHFDRPYKHARHYLGFAENLERRLAEHRRADPGCYHRLMIVIHAAGIGFTLARTWNGGRELERRLKRHGGATRLCPLCTPHGTRGGKTT